LLDKIDPLKATQLLQSVGSTRRSGLKTKGSPVALIVTLGLALPPGLSLAAYQQQTEFQPGSPGAGDPYFPLGGNGGYDVQRYLLKLTYDPATDLLAGVAMIRARATQDLSRFNLDLDGLTVRSITVNSRRATWTRDAGELTVSPHSGLRAGRRFTTVALRRPTQARRRSAVRSIRIHPHR